MGAEPPFLGVIVLGGRGLADVIIGRGRRAGRNLGAPGFGLGSAIHLVGRKGFDVEHLLAQEVTESIQVAVVVRVGGLLVLFEPEGFDRVGRKGAGDLHRGSIGIHEIPARRAADGEVHETGHDGYGRAGNDEIKVGMLDFEAGLVCGQGADLVPSGKAGRCG